MAGVCYVVATPIGNLQDISARALRILSEVGFIGAEDTRVSQHLLHHYNIATELVALHAHNEAGRVNYCQKRLASGENMALISDAGTPLISDPGARLLPALRKAGVKIIPIPGPCALTCALSASGMPADSFVFLGFLPTKASSRAKLIEQLKTAERTTAFYEAPHRILASLELLQAELGPDREVCLARELTKQFETIHVAKLADLVKSVSADSNQRRGEFVVIVAPNPADKHSLLPEDLKTLQALLAELPLKQAVGLAASITGKSRNDLYKWAVANKG